MDALQNKPFLVWFLDLCCVLPCQIEPYYVINLKPILPVNGCYWFKFPLFILTCLWGSSEKNNWRKIPLEFFLMKGKYKYVNAVVLRSEQVSWFHALSLISYRENRMKLLYRVFPSSLLIFYMYKSRILQLLGSFPYQTSTWACFYSYSVLEQGKRSYGS